MTLNEIVAATPSDGWLLHLPQLRDLCERLHASKQELEVHLRQFQAAIENDHLANAVNIISVGLIADATFLSMVRRKGLLRLSKYRFQEQCAAQVVDELLRSDISSYLETNHFAYFVSLHNLKSLSSNIRLRHDRLLVELREGREATLKGVLATIDFLFMKTAWFGLSHGGHGRRSSDYDFFTIEQYAEAFSYLRYLYNENLGSLKDSPPLNLSQVLGDHNMGMLLSAAHIRSFFEMETLIDVFDYRVVTEGNNAMAFLPPNAELEKAIRLGYIESDIQNMTSILRNTSDDIASVRMLGEALYKAVGKHGIILRQDPERYIFGIPDIPNIFDPVKSDSLFLEEYIALVGAEKELMAPQRTLANLNVNGDITIMDLLRVQRIINFIRWYATSHLMQILATQPERISVIFESLIAFYQDTVLRSMLSIVVPMDKINAVLGILSWSPENQAMFDVQYQPLIPVGDGYWIPMNIAGSNNILRNVLQLTRRRLYEDGQDDPVVAILKYAFSQHSASVVSNKTYVFGERKGEIDVAAIVGNVLFVFECKNPLVPTSPHELRTSWDYIKKASAQLTTIRDAFLNNDHRVLLEAVLNMSLNNVERIETCIVMSNRMFIGYRNEGHPVRSLFELIHYLAEGTVFMGNESFCYWQGDSLTAIDLVRYLADDLTFEHRWKAMVEYDEHLIFGELTVRRPSFFLDMKRAAEILGFVEAAHLIDQLKKEHKSAGTFAPSEEPSEE